MTGHGLRGRTAARTLIFVAIALDATVGFVLIAAPNHMGPMSGEPLALVGGIVPAIGIAANILGLAWMVRIYRADPEASRSAWRAVRHR